MILHSSLEASLQGRNDNALGVGSGLSTLDAGLRLRYEWHRQFAPYIGVSHVRAFGRTAEFRRNDGDDTDETLWLVGVRVWL